MLRIAGFGLSTVSTSKPLAIPAQYLLLAIVSAGSLWMILRGVIIDAPANLLGVVNNLLNRVAALRTR